MPRPPNVFKTMKSSYRIKIVVKNEFDEFCKKQKIRPGLALEKLMLLLMKHNKKLR